MQPDVANWGGASSRVQESTRAYKNLAANLSLLRKFITQHNSGAVQPMAQVTASVQALEKMRKGGGRPGVSFEF